MATRKMTTDLAGRSDEEILNLPHKEFLEALGFAPTPGTKAAPAVANLAGADSLAAYSDEELVHMLKTGEQPGGRANLSHDAGGTADHIEGLLLRATGADLAQKTEDEMSDDEFYEAVLRERDGSAQLERTGRMLNAEFEAELADAKAAHERGEPINRWYEECLRDRGSIS